MHRKVHITCILYILQVQCMKYFLIQLKNALISLVFVYEVACNLKLFPNKQKNRIVQKISLLPRPIGKLGSFNGLKKGPLKNKNHNLYIGV